MHAGMKENDGTWIDASERYYSGNLREPVIRTLFLSLPNIVEAMLGQGFSLP